jgi:diguanylate cyclase (GGDEF)-like protein
VDNSIEFDSPAGIHFCRAGDRRVQQQAVLHRHQRQLAVRNVLRAERGKHPIAVALIDFDRFKSINDQFGHAVGDNVLRLGAAAIVAALRPTDIVGRWGGEELLVVLPHTQLAAARLALEAALAAVRALVVQVASGRVTVTFSAGVIEMIDNQSLDQLVARADVVLYEASARAATG